PRPPNCSVSPVVDADLFAVNQNADLVLAVLDPGLAHFLAGIDGLPGPAEFVAFDVPDAVELDHLAGIGLGLTARGPVRLQGQLTRVARAGAAKTDRPVVTEESLQLVTGHCLLRQSRSCAQHKCQCHQPQHSRLLYLTLCRMITRSCSFWSLDTRDV